MVFRHHSGPCAFERDQSSAARQDASNLDAEFDGAALVVDRLAGGADGCDHLVEGGVVDRAADQGVTGGLDVERTGGDGAQADTGGGALAAAVKGQGNAAPTTAMSISVRGMKRR